MFRVIGARSVVLAAALVLAGAAPAAAREVRPGTSRPA
jgi:hypothetical protein